MSYPVQDQPAVSTSLLQNLSASNTVNPGRHATNKVSQTILNTQTELNTKSLSSPQLSGQIPPSYGNFHKNKDERCRTVTRELSQNKSANPALESIAVHRKRTLNGDNSISNLSQNLILPLSAQIDLHSDETDETSSELSPGRKSSISVTDTSPRSDIETSTSSSSSEHDVSSNSSIQVNPRKMTKRISTKSISKKIRSFNLPTNSSRVSKEEPAPPKLNIDACRKELDLLTKIINSLTVAGESTSAMSLLGNQMKKTNFEVLLEMENEFVNTKDYYVNSEKFIKVYHELLQKPLVFYKSMTSFLKLLDPIETKITEDKTNLEINKTTLIQALQCYLTNEKYNNSKIRGFAEQVNEFSKNAKPIFFEEDQITNIVMVLFTNFINLTVLLQQYITLFGNLKFKILQNNSVAITKSGRTGAYFCIIITRQMAQYEGLLNEFEKKLIFQLEWKEKSNCPHPYEDKFLAEVENLKKFLTEKQGKINALVGEVESIKIKHELIKALEKNNDFPAENDD